MTTYALPDRAHFFPAAGEWGLRSNVWPSPSPLNGVTQTVALPGGVWIANLTFRPQSVAERAELEGWLTGLGGQEHRVQMAHPVPSRWVPRGTMRGSPALSSAASQFANQLAIQTSAPGVTLLQGDFIKVGSQVYQVVSDATADGSSVLTVTVTPRVRTAHALAAAVTWNKPTAIFMLAGNEVLIPHTPGMSPAFAVQFIEDPQ